MLYFVLLIAIIGVGCAVYSILQLRGLQRRFTAALGDVSADSLESTLARHLSRVEDVDNRLRELNTSYDKLVITNSLASQKISVVRFNPFGDTGGDQSFSLAVLDAHDSGYVLTSIHGRQGTRVYVKPVDYAKSKYGLSAEEQQALSQAIKRVPQIDKP